MAFIDLFFSELVMNNLDENHPVMSSEWVNGPRYCPSLGIVFECQTFQEHEKNKTLKIPILEAKVMRFGHLDHRV